MYKVFFKESCFLLTDDQNLLKEAPYSLRHQDFNATKTFIRQLLNENQKFTAVLYDEDLEELFSIFKSCFLYVKAAGGVVQQEGRILIIKRLGVYDLPKGHLETCETIEQCAIREVEEECGLEHVQVTGHLTDTLHIYYRNENWYLKKTYWYKMICPPDPILIPQTEEEIENVFWQPVSQLEEIKTNTYPSLLEVFELIKPSL